MHKGIRLIRELVKQPAFAELCGEEIFPGEPVQSDAQLDASLNSHVYTQWHLSGTARMGSNNDKGAVVDVEGRVHGLQGLRVVDASIMPSVTNGNTNAPTIMIAEKLSDAILGNTPLPRNEAEVWQSSNFENSQR
jgi:choline dehydrogenase